MKRFRFRLQAALDHRRRKEDLVRTELAQLQNRRLHKLQRLERLQEAQVREMQVGATHRTGRIEPSEEHSREQRLAALEDEIVAQKNVLDLLGQEIEQKIEQVVTATQETKILERLRERYAEEHSREELREEQEFLDEMASIRQNRRQSEAA